MTTAVKDWGQDIHYVRKEVNYRFIPTQRLFDKHFDEIMKLPYWVFDTETTGTDPISDKVIMAQIGNSKIQYLIDTREVNISRLGERLEDETFKKIVQNGKFDYKMLLGSFGTHLEGMRDTMLAEQLLTAGIQKRGFGLEDICYKYLNIKIDKEMQSSFINHTGPFTERQMQYAALDCVYPDHVIKEQMEHMKRLDLVQAWLIECDALPAFADLEYYGLNLDQDLWKRNIIKAKDSAFEYKRQFLKEAAEYEEDRNLFGEVNLNPNSSAQVLKLFKKVFGEENVKDSDGKAGTGDEVLQKLNEKFGQPNLVTALQEIRGNEKLAGTYGESYLLNVHPKSKRFHPRISQVGTETGRPSGKKPNMLNIPALPDYRHAWGGVLGRKMLTDDYGACELRIMASASGDPVMCKGFNEGLDYHTYTASQFIVDDQEYLREYIPDPNGEAGKGKLGEFIFKDGQKVPNPNFGQLVPYDRVLKIQRTVAKTINFGLAYGMGAGKLSRTLKISMDKAREYIQKFNSTFETLVKWLKKNQELALIPRAISFQEMRKARSEGREPVADLAYAETYLGRKRFFTIPKRPAVLDVAHLYQRVPTGKTKEKVFTVPDIDRPGMVKKERREVPVYIWKGPDLPTLSYNPLNPWDDNLPETLRKYYQRVAGIKREGGNSPIQGANADITKIAMCEMRRWIRSLEKEQNQGRYLAHVALQVYDELIVDCPEGMSDLFSKKMDEIMQEAGRKVIKNVPVETGCIVADTWVKG